MAIGIEAFNRFSQLKNEAKSKSKEEVVMSPKTSRQEDEVSAVSEFPPVQYVCQQYMINIFNYCIVYLYLSCLQNSNCLTR